VDEFLEIVTGLNHRPDGFDEIPNIFSTNLSISARKRLEKYIHKLIALTAAAYPDEGFDRQLERIVQWFMGRDSLLGTISQSLHYHLTSTDGKKLSDMPYNAVPTHTGLSVIGRVALQDTHVGGCPVSKSTLVECRLDSLNGTSDRERLRFFGAGAHLCLGRPLALMFTEIFAQEISKRDYGLKIVDFQAKKDDVFDLAAVFQVQKIYFSAMD